MSARIVIRIADLILRAQLNESESARSFLDLLPVTFTMSRWGEEYYGNCGIKVAEAGDARTDMKIGEIALWPPGNALCIFFGPTPISVDDSPKAASAVNPIGMIIDDLAPLKKLGDEIEVTVERDPQPRSAKI